jgi:hypothetical protein
LEDVVSALLDPDETSLPGRTLSDGVKELAQAGIITRPKLIDWGLPVMSALSKWLPGGEWAGLFDGQTRGPTGRDIDLANPLVVFDTSDLPEGSVQLAAAMLVAAAWIQGRWMPTRGDKLLIFEENYSAADLPGVDVIQQAFALRGRGSGLAVVSVFHHLAQIPPHSKLWSLIRDAGLVVMYRQDTSADIDECVRYFNLPDQAAGMLPNLQQGCCLAKVGQQPLEVWQHLRTVQEIWITDTNTGLAGRSLESPATPIAYDNVEGA